MRSPWYRACAAAAASAALLTLMPPPSLAAARSTRTEASVRVRLMRDIRSLGHRIRADLQRALTDYDRLPGRLAGMRAGGLTARQRSVTRASTDALGPLHDLVDAARALRAVDKDSRALAHAHATVIGLAAASRDLRAELMALEKLSVMAGASAQTMSAMAHFARLVEDNRTTLLLGQRPAPAVLRGMAAWTAQARRYSAETVGVSDPFLAVLRLYVALGAQGYARLKAGGMAPWQAMSYEGQAHKLKASLVAALPGFQTRVAARMVTVDRAALAAAMRVDTGSATRLHAHPTTAAAGASHARKAHRAARR